MKERGKAIRTAALHLFAEEGYEGASLSKIAGRVGIRKSSLYNHCSSKEDLFLSLVEEVYSRYIQELKKIVSGSTGTAEKKLYSTFIATTDFITREGTGRFYMHFLLFPPSELEEKVRTRFLSFEEETNQLLLPVLKKGIADREIRDSDPSILLHAFYCMIDGMSSQMFYYPALEAAQKREHAWGIFWRGIRHGKEQ
ncbi:TetR/AcrR family transcriptional regulator [Alteribacter natronophilus]|uniref:TetR/AcrR family transcriptional regulator n=1 Tax=Alteribacter natronophilus TaxID=2583810 RepID=UPI001485E043|nr:TetR/AcrR family transcriptional regulator [Alteribacter natronophilus]